MVNIRAWFIKEFNNSFRDVIPLKVRIRFILRLFLPLGLFFILLCPTGLAAECSSLPSYDGSIPMKKNEKSVTIVAIGSDKSSPTLLVSLLLSDQLAFAKSVRILPVVVQEKKDLKGTVSSDYILQVSTQPVGQPNFRVEALLIPQDPKNALQSVRFEGQFAFPLTMNDALLSLSEKIASHLQASWKVKKVLPYLYTSPSPEAALNYAQGRYLLESLAPLTQERAMEAARYFNQAIQSDYNYVYAYMGHAEALGALGTMIGNEKALGQSNMQMMKAEVLNPPMTKLKKGRVQWYLKQSCQGAG